MGVSPMHGQPAKLSKPRLGVAQMTGLKTKDSLLRALREASSQPASAEELHKQRVSFIMGSLKKSSNVTRERVESVLAEQEGRKAS